MTTAVENTSQMLLNPDEPAARTEPCTPGVATVMAYLSTVPPPWPKDIAASVAEFRADLIAFAEAALMHRPGEHPAPAAGLDRVRAFAVAGVLAAVDAPDAVQPFTNQELRRVYLDHRAAMSSEDAT